MTEQEFIRKNAALWRELEKETAFFASHRRRRLFVRQNNAVTRERIDRFSSLYRDAANHLALCRTFYGETETGQYLNRIVGEAHGVLYSRSGFRPGAALRYIASGFPAAFRQLLPYFVAAALLMILPGLAAYLFSAADPENALLFLDASTLANLREEGNYDEFRASVSAAMGAYIGGNNIVVCLEALAGGFTCGIFTAYALVTNGVMLGALAGYSLSRGSSVFFWSLILPHGITELFAIMLSGMTGLMLADSFLRPGKLRRTVSLAAAGKKSVGIICECILLLIFSAAVESWFTPLNLPYWIKYSFAGAVFAFLVLWLCLAGRQKHRQSSADPCHTVT